MQWDLTGGGIMQAVNAQSGVPRVVCCKPEEQGKCLANKVYGWEKSTKKRCVHGFHLPFPRNNRDTKEPETGKIAEVIRSTLNSSALTHTFRRLTFIKKKWRNKYIPSHLQQSQTAPLLSFPLSQSSLVVLPRQL